MANSDTFSVQTSISEKRNLPDSPEVRLWKITADLTLSPSTFCVFGTAQTRPKTSDFGQFKSANFDLIESGVYSREEE
jgi:hypothetical protein